MRPETTPEHIPDEDQQRPSWWVCTNWVETPAKPAEFVYGIAAHCRRPAQGACSKVLIDSAPWTLVQYEAILSEEQFQNVIGSAAQGAINFGASLVRDTRRLDIVASRSFIGNSLGRPAATFASYATCTTPPSLANARDSWTSVLKALEADLGLAFSNEDADRIGCFDVATLQPWLEDPPPVLVEAIVPDTETRQTAGVRQLHICRSGEFSTTRHLAHIVCFREERRLIDRLIILEPGTRRSAPIEAPYPVERFEFSLFSEGGDLLHREGASFIGSFQLTMGIQGRELQLDDDLARKANSQKKKGDAPHGRVTSVTHERSLSTFATDNESWARHRMRMSELRRLCFPSPSYDRWFSRSLDDELGVIAHFDKLLNGGDIRAAVLVDPFFGADALQRFALRLSSTDVKITIITSWGSTDPDTGMRHATSAMAVTQLEALLRTTRHFINPCLTVINLANGSEQAFHDRYLLLYPRKGAPQVYLLSNSVNAMAANWPFCISLLADDVRQQALAYIEGLCNGVDITGATKPKITFRWPSDA